MADLIKVFTGSSGLNNKVDPVRLRFDGESGIAEFKAAVNVDIDQTGRVSRRSGYALWKSGSWHSLFSCGAYVLAVSGSSLGILYPDMTFVAIATVQQGAKVSYGRVGNRVYWTNGFQKGFVANKVNCSWTAAGYVGPATTKTFSSPPLGHLLEVFSGRMYVAQDLPDYSVLWYSQPFAYHWFDLAQNFIPFEGKIREVKGVAGGLYVSTEDKTYFLKGSAPQEMYMLEVAEYPMIKGTACKVQLGKTPYREILQGIGLVWGSEKGICLGGSNGEFFNLTEKKLVLPSVNKGVGFVNEDKYYCLLEE